MNQKLQGALVGVLVGATLVNIPTLARQAAERIEVVYDDIKILIDGKEFQPTDVNGNTVEPFIYNGTTYLPVRAIANAFDKEVDWEPQTSTVSLGGKNYDWLDQMVYVDYEVSKSVNSVHVLGAKTEANDGMRFDRGLKMELHYGKGDGILKLNDGTQLCYQEISYLLNKNYKEFSGTIFVRDFYTDTRREQHALAKIYGDGELLYTSPLLMSNSRSLDFCVNVEDCKVLKIKVEIPNVEDTYGKISIGLGDARLSKK